MKKTLFNKDWYFSELELNTSYADGLKSTFKPVDIPHDWMIHHVNDLYKNSIGFYKKTFTARPVKDHTYILRFEGVYMDVTIYLNDTQIYEWKYGYSTFDVDLTPYLKEGDNTVCVLCNYQCPNTRWYSGAGIYRNIYLYEKEASYMPLDGVYIYTSAKEKDFTVTLETEAVSLALENATIRHTVLNKEGETVYELSDDVSLNKEVLVNKQSFLFENPTRWDINNPYFYTVKTELIVNGEVVDEYDNPLGLRTISFDPDHGFFLNGRNIKINGVCQHHDLGALGAAFNKAALRRQFEKLLKMGVNSVRTSHNMPAKELMELADEMGILIYSESFDMWELPKTTYDYGNFFPTWYEKDVKSWVRRDRNHPSLIIWGIGNEIYDTHAGTGLKWTILLRDAVKKYDPMHNAYIGIGSNYIEWENAQKCSDELELSGYNYGEKLYEKHHKKYPHWCIFGSETASTVQSRGIYHFPYEIRILTYQDGQCSSLGNCSTNWGAKSAAYTIAAHRDHDYVFGQYLWTGWDYIGEPTPYFTKNSFFGQIDTAGFEKDTYYQYEAEWTQMKENPMVHLLPYWDFNEGQIIDICAYSNAPYVELFFNGISQGKQFIDHKSYDLQGHWKLPYTKGELVVKAYDDEGNVIATDSTKSFSDPERIVLSADKTTLTADGLDLAFIEISLADKDGIYVANAKNRVSVSVKGAGRLVGLDNGDSTDYEEYKTTNRRLFSGKLIAIIAAKDVPGDITVTVSGEGLKSDTINLTSVESIDEVNVPCYEEIKECPCPKDVPIRKIELSLEGTTHLNKEITETKVSFKIYPENATYSEVYFKALTKDAVDANFVKINVEENTATLTALGDGEFTLNAFANNDKDHPEIISTLAFDITGLGLANFNAYTMVPGIEYAEVHSLDAKLSFLGGVFMPVPKDGRAYVTFENVDFGEFGSDEVHVPIFSFHDEMPIEILEGDIRTGTCVYKGIYQAKSWYNHYQENVYKLPRRIKGVSKITFAFTSDERFSLQGFYFTKLKKAYSLIPATEYSRITGDSFEVEKDAITSIGNNVCIEYENMHFDEGLSSITITGKSNNANASIHILFTEGEKSDKQLIEIPYSEDYKEYTFDLKNSSVNGKVSFMFLPGSNFDLKEFKFNK